MLDYSFIKCGPQHGEDLNDSHGLSIGRPRNRAEKFLAEIPFLHRGTKKLIHRAHVLLKQVLKGVFDLAHITPASFSCS